MFTYNYNEASGLMLSNTDYTICVRTERNFCGIQYSTCGDTLNNPSMSFSITGLREKIIHIFSKKLYMFFPKNYIHNNK